MKARRKRNPAIEAKLQADKDIRKELTRQGKTYISCSKKQLKLFLCYCIEIGITD